MKLYVWTEFCPDYCDGLAFAIANNIDEAKKLVIESNGVQTTDEEFGSVSVYTLQTPRAFCVMGGS